MNEFVHRTVAPARPPAPYIGGKRHLADRLARLIQSVPHRTYAEPFLGMGGVFFRRRRVPPSEVINDRSGDVVTLFRILQRHFAPFMDMLRYQVTTRDDFDRLLATDPSTLTDLERAARFLYLQRASYGGKVTTRSFGISRGAPGGFDVTKLGSTLAEIHRRIAGVIVENLPFEAFIARYAGPDVLFYCDPPYFGSEGDYGAGLFARVDFEVLARALLDSGAHVILSINATEETRAIFADFDQETVDVTYTINGPNPLPARELIVTSRGLPRRDERQAALFAGL